MIKKFDDFIKEDNMITMSYIGTFDIDQIDADMLKKYYKDLITFGYNASTGEYNIIPHTSKSFTLSFKWSDENGNETTETISKVKTLEIEEFVDLLPRLKDAAEYSLFY